MAERELSDEEAAALGLPVGPVPREREVSLEEAQRIGLEPRSEPSLGRSIAVKVAEGATKGWLDELGGLINKARLPKMARALDPNTGQPVGPDVGPYELTRDAIRRESGEVEKARPKLSFGSKLAGDAASDYLLSRIPGAGGLVTTAPGQAALGGLSGAGYSADKTAGGVAKDAAVGSGAALVGYGIGKHVVPRVAGALRQPVKRALQDFAAKRAVKATGAIQNNIKGIPEEKLLETGRILLEQGVVRPFRSPSGVKAAADEALERLGPAVGETLKRADLSAAPVALGPGVTRSGRTPAFDWGPVRARLQQMAGGLNPVDRRAAASALRYLDDIEEAAAQGGGFRAANELKSSVQKGINWQTEPKTTGEVAKQIQHILKDEVDTQLEKAMGEQVGQEFLDSKRLYAAMANAAKWGKRGAERETGNRFVSPSDYGAGLAAAVGTGNPAAAAVAFLHKLARERGASVTASGAHALSKAVPGLAKASGSKALTQGELLLLRQWLAKQEAGGEK